MEGVRKTPHLGPLGYLSTAHSLCLSTSITPHEQESLCQSTSCFLPSHCPAALPLPFAQEALFIGVLDAPAPQLLPSLC